MPPTPTHGGGAVADLAHPATSRHDLEASVGPPRRPGGIGGSCLPVSRRGEVVPGTWLIDDACDVDRRARGLLCTGSRRARRRHPPHGESHLPGMRPERPVECESEGLEVDRLHQMAVEARLPGSHDVVVTAECRDCNRPKLGESGIRPQTLKNRKAIHPGHPKIQQEEVGGLLVQPGQGSVAVSGRVDARTEPLHHLPKNVPAVLVVVDDQDRRTLKRASQEKALQLARRIRHVAIVARWTAVGQELTKP
jgi:hypothetical protein